MYIIDGPRIAVPLEMNMIDLYLRRALVCALLPIASTCLAGTVITSGLPTGVAIVNIDARNDGASGYDSGQSNWYSPFAGSGSLLSLTVDPGTYSFEVVDPAAAVKEFPNLTSSQQSELYTSWTYNSPWITDYLVFDSSAATNSSQAELLSGAVIGRASGYASYPGWNGGGYSTPDEAFAAATGGGVYNKVYVGGRATGTEQDSFAIDQTRTLLFAIPDNGIWDNAGGVSVVVRKIDAVPEPAPVFALTGALIGAVKRRTVTKRRRLQKGA